MQLCFVEVMFDGSVKSLWWWVGCDGPSMSALLSDATEIYPYDECNGVLQLFSMLTKSKSSKKLVLKFGRPHVQLQFTFVFSKASQMINVYYIY